MLPSRHFTLHPAPTTPSSHHTLITPAQGAALFLLERYEEAEASYLEGLLLEPENETLRQGLEQVGLEQVGAGAGCLLARWCSWRLAAPVGYYLSLPTSHLMELALMQTPQVQQVLKLQQEEEEEAMAAGAGGSGAESGAAGGSDAAARRRRSSAGAPAGEAPGSFSKR